MNPCSARSPAERPIYTEMKILSNNGEGVLSKQHCHLAKSVTLVVGGNVGRVDAADELGVF